MPVTGARANNFRTLRYSLHLGDEDGYYPGTVSFATTHGEPPNTFNFYVSHDGEHAHLLILRAGYYPKMDSPREPLTWCYKKLEQLTREFMHSGCIHSAETSFTQTLRR